MPKKMICTVSEHACTDAQIQAAEQALTAVYQQHFGAGSKLLILWCKLPEEQSYVAGAADVVCIAMFEVDEDIEQPLRETAMLDVNRCLAESFSVPLEKPLVSALSSSKVNEYLRGNRNRLRRARRPGFLLSTLWHAVSSKRRQGYASIRANL